MSSIPGDGLVIEVVAVTTSTAFTLAVVEFHGASLADVAIFAAAIAYIVDRVIRSLGLSRSAEQLRAENVDLLRRNGELEQTVARHEQKIGELVAKVGELERSSQAAVLHALERHEERATERSVAYLAKQDESVSLLERAVVVLENLPNPSTEGATR